MSGGEQLAEMDAILSSIIMMRELKKESFSETEMLECVKLAAEQLVAATSEFPAEVLPDASSITSPAAAGKHFLAGETPGQGYLLWLTQAGATVTLVYQSVSWPVGVGQKVS